MEERQEEALSGENLAVSSDSPHSLSELSFTDNTNAGWETKSKERDMSSSWCML